MRSRPRENEAAPLATPHSSSGNVIATGGEGAPPAGANGSGWNFPIYSPIDGRVLRVLQESAAVVTPGTPLLELGDPLDLEVVVDVLSRDAVEIHQRDFARPSLEHGNPRVDDVLAILCRLVLSVLAQVPEFAGPLDLFRQIDLQLTFKHGDFIIESLENPVFHR